MTKLDTKIVLNRPAEKPVAAVILLHGMGADYNDFVPLVAELKLPISVKFVFPNASVIPVTINNGLKMRAWYDILDFGDLHREVDTRGVLQNVAKINCLIEELIASCNVFDSMTFLLDMQTAHDTAATMYPLNNDLFINEFLIECEEVAKKWELKYD